MRIGGIGAGKVGTAMARRLVPKEHQVMLSYSRNTAGLAICGIALEIGLEPTVRHATDLGFVPAPLTDTRDAGNAEAGVRAAESMRFMGEAIMTGTAAFCAGLRGAA